MSAAEHGCLGENDRSATGFLARDEQVEIVASGSDFFTSLKDNFDALSRWSW